LDTSARKYENDQDEGNIWTLKGEGDRRMVLGGIFWTQETASERMMVLRGIFGPEKEEVIGGLC